MGYLARYFGLGILFLLVFSLISAGADVAVTLANNQGTATPSNFQQMIIFNPQISLFSSSVSSDLGNIRFYQGGIELHSWCESGCSSSSANAVFWVLIPSGIGANAVDTISMTFLPASTEYDGIYAGEAPQLSATYGEYDNGSNVFTFYDNFANNQPGSSWTNNNFPFNSIGYETDNAGSLAYVVANNGIGTAFDSYVNGSAGNSEEMGYFDSASTNSLDGETIGFACDNIYPYISEGGQNTGCYWEQQTYPYSTAQSVFTVIPLSANEMHGYENYGNVLSSNGAPTGDLKASFSTHIQYVGFKLQNGWLHIGWARLRNAPPNGVMPSVTFSPVYGALVLHPNGRISMHNAAANTNVSRGQALQEVLSNVISGDKIYLGAETYDMMGYTIDLSKGNTLINVSILGAGKYKTVLTNYTGYDIGANSVTADMSLINTGGRSFTGIPVSGWWGTPLGDSSTVYGGSVLRNVYLDTSVPGIRLWGVMNANVYMYNVTTAGSWQNDMLIEPSSGSGTAYIFDSNISADYACNGSCDYGLSVYSNAVVVNTLVRAVFSSGVYSCAGIKAAGAATYIYGGSASVTCGAAEADLSNAGSGAMYVNSTTRYSTTYGAITKISTGYGSYPYPRGPMPLPMVLSGNSISASNQVLDIGQTQTISVAWNGGASPYSANYLIYNSVGLCQSRLYAGIGGLSNTYSYATSSACGTGTITANSIITDNALAQATNSVTYSVNQMPAITISPSANMIYALQSVVFANTTKYGTSPYTFAYLVFQFGTAANTGNYLVSGNKIEFTDQGTYNVIETVTDHVGSTTSSPNSRITVNQLPAIPQPQPLISNPPAISNSTMDIGQVSTANTVISGGVGQYSGGWTFMSSNSAGNNVVNTITARCTHPYGVAFNPSGTLAYVVNYGCNGISVINVATNTVVNTITVGINPTYVGFNPSGTLAYVANAGGSGTVSVINVATNTVINTVTVGGSPSGVAFSPSGAIAYVANDGSGTVSVINVAANTVVNTITVGANPIGVAFFPSGAIAYVTNEGSGTVSVINVAANIVITTIAVGTDPIGVAFNPQGNLAYVANYQSGTVSVINVATYTVINTIKVAEGVQGVAFNPSGTLAYVADGMVIVINVATNTIISKPRVGSIPIGVAFNPSGTLAYVTNEGTGTVSVISPSATPIVSIPTSNNALALAINAASSNTMSVAFNGGAQQFTTGSSAIYGRWTLYGFGEDSTTGLGGTTGLAGMNTVTVPNTLIINSRPTATALTPSTSALTSGQTATYNVLISGGTGPFTANLVLAGTTVNTITGASQGIVAFGAIIPPFGSQSYNAIVTDMGTTTPYVFNSMPNTITVGLYNPLAFNSLTISNSTVDGNQMEVLTAYVYNGVGPYTYNIMVYNSVGLVADQFAATALTHNSFAFAQNPNWGAGTFTVNIMVQDSNSPATILSNTLYYFYTANAALYSAQTFAVAALRAAVPTPTISIAPSSTSIGTGGDVTFTNTTAGGTPPYTFSYIVNASGVAISNNTATFADPGTYNVTESVTESAGITANSSAVTITVANSAAESSITTVSPSAEAIDVGQNTTFTDLTAGGIPPYTYPYTGTYNVTGNVTGSAGTAAVSNSTSASVTDSLGAASTTSTTSTSTTSTTTTSTISNGGGGGAFTGGSPPATTTTATSSTFLSTTVATTTVPTAPVAAVTTTIQSAALAQPAATAMPPTPPPASVNGGFLNGLIQAVVNFVEGRLGWY
jgi:YVTN family beta-propeller protein